MVNGLLCAPAVFFQPEEATISAPCCHEFPIVEHRDPLLEPCSGDADSLLLNIQVKCLSCRAKAAHISGHLPVIAGISPMFPIPVLCTHPIRVTSAPMAHWGRERQVSGRRRQPVVM